MIIMVISNKFYSFVAICKSNYKPAREDKLTAFM